MMTSLVVGLLLAPLHYTFEPGARINYDSKIVFEGFIPILGGNEGTVVVEMGVAVEGLERKKPDVLRAANEITRFKVTFNEAPLPLDVTSVQPYFPRTTISLSESGKILESDAPNVSLPVRLPGLDVKRFPDITYVPVEFPTRDTAVGDTWTFKKKFGESDVEYVCKLEALEDDIARIAVAIKQEYTLLENSALEVVKDEKDAEHRVKTTMKGTGSVRFDLKRGFAVQVAMVNDAVSEVTDIADGAKSERKLKTSFSLGLQAPSASRPDEGWLQATWRTVVRTASETWATLRLAWQAAFARAVGRT